ncbi:PAS domain S-box protein [Methanosarcina barkeri]|uniref:Sensory transduction histidine kinase n=2 Tax=Methanosarcina barkeri TaxID=2208 RepID=A0A0G3CAN0_METBA|nr:PAS domain S-box protein [Methanosarcina barkeri]AKB58287.1 sensory transduction histidine kinase [Methanosarcina barkeri 227]AKJ39069.1 sensory transduction histidine kinase [Methanosarcina barkeri CM1]
MKNEQSQAIDSNPVLSVAKDGVILYSNKAGEPLLRDWGIRVGEKLPLRLEIFVQRAISRKSIEKIEVTMGKKVYFIVFHLSPEQECVNIYGFDISDRKKLERKCPESETQEKEKLELSRIIDTKAVQSLMSDFYTLAHIPMALLDLEGNILVSVGWQDICIKFHRVSPEACKHCVESDINLTAGVVPGGYKLYKCKNNMWDVVTPVMVEGQHVGNIFSGQFFFDDEPLNYELFRSQARQYGFNEEEYLKKLKKVPRLSREAVDTSMAFFMTFANMISQLSYSNIKLSRSLAERDAVVDALRESEKREHARSEELTVLLDAVPVAVYIAHDPQVFQITGNRLSYEWLRIPAGTNFSKSAPEGEKPEMFKLLKDGVELQPEDMPSQLSATGIEINDCELDIVSAEGKIRHVLGNARPLLDEQGNIRGSISAFIDITERKKAEEAIKLSNLYNRSLIEASLDPMITIGLDGKIMDLNDATEQVTGYSRNNLIGTDFSDYFTEPEKARAGYQQVFKDSEVRDYPLEIRHKDGHITPVLYNASVYRNENDEVTGVFAAARDITELKRAEEALLESESRLRLAQVSAGAGIWDWNMSADKIEWSKDLFCLFGLDPKKSDASFDLWRSVIYPDDRLVAEKRIETAINNHISLTSEYRIVLPSGEVRWINALGNTTYDNNGKPQRMSGICIDITERKRVEEALRDSEERFRALVTASSEMVYRVNPDWSEMRYFYGRGFLANTESPSNTWIHEYVPPEDQQHVMAVINEAIRTKTTYELEHRVRLADGNLGWIFSRAVPMLDENGEIVEWFGAASDITERKEAEVKLKKAHENLEKMVEERTAELEKAYNSLKESEKGLAEAQKMSHIGNWEWDMATSKVYWSEEMYRIFRRESQESAPPYNEFLNCIHPDDRDYVDAALAIKKAVKGQTNSIEYRIILANGEERIVHMQSEVIFDEKNNPLRAKGIIQDITERKEAEKALANVEIVRKKEIHHRIKNNLQVISSLLDLQADKFNNPRVIEAFRESQNRVISMALIHEELYKGEGTDALDFSTYIRELTENLFQTYSLKSKNIHLSMDLEENVFLNMDTGIPLGIVINELVSNSLKHAFLGKDRGEIQIKLHREKNSKYKKEKEANRANSFILVVSDNGVGIPENLDIKNVDSLGIQLITTLADQLDGEFELKRNNGTEFTMRFTVIDKR